MRIRPRFRLLAVIAFAWALTIGGAGADAASIEDFYGEYEGTADTVSSAELSKRELAVKIEGREEGFTVTWTTIRRKSEDRVKKKSYSIDFDRTGTPSIYQSAMRKDMFGNKVPLNPLKGDPYVWATLYGETLTVYALLISDDGEYELQQYDRTLVPGGLRLDFSRIREGEELKKITADLKKIGD